MATYLPRPYCDPSDTTRIVALASSVRPVRLLTEYPSIYDLPAFLSLAVNQATTRLWLNEENHLVGFAYVENRTPYDPDKTVFWAASVAKAFTAVGVLQLYDRGWIDLDRDVNPYLEAFQIPDGYSRPVTFAHLPTHTDGFEARIGGDAEHRDGYGTLYDRPIAGRKPHLERS